MRTSEAIAARKPSEGGTLSSISIDRPLLIGESPSIKEINSAIDLVAKSPTSVLISGKSGTGKEVVARLIHLKSDRSDKPFIAINCGALPRDVIENELFGHELGAFTGALLKKPGCFELANGGTLFFDEIAEMHPETQVKLLRAIENQSFRRLGGVQEIRVDVRMLAATNRDIPTSLKNGDLREDLYYRFSVIEIFLPPLSDRPEDIPLLVDGFLSMFSLKHGTTKQRFSSEALRRLQGYSWPGNVRELKNVVERSVVVCKEPIITESSLPKKIVTQEEILPQISIPLGTPLHEAERRIILQTLASVDGNRSAAARILSITRRTLVNKLSIYNQKS